MSVSPDPRLDNPFAVLRQFARRRPAAERCEMCSRELLPEHEHLVEPASHKLICSCDACAILFHGQSGSKYKRVPHEVYFLKDFALSDGQWENLTIPIEMAFFFKSTPQEKVIALYPSPAGAVESLLPLETWNQIAETNPVLSEMEADVVALLANRVGSKNGARAAEYYLVPIDQCYILVGLLRSQWRGLSGGSEVWRAVDEFFVELKKKAITAKEAARV
jgi:hypothetical protein